MAIAPVPISELPKPREVGVPAAPGLLGRVLGLKDTESERRIGDAGVIAAVGGRGVLPGLHSPEMLVERVFLVGGVVKTVFCRFKKKRFFCFSTRTKGSKADFVVISKSPLFSTETLRICSITSWFNFFLPEETAGEILCVSVELVLYFSFRQNGGRKFFACPQNLFCIFLSVRNGGRKFYA
jgi:hypothetical protein